MSAERPKGKDEAKQPSKDITPVLNGWEYESGTINVRKIVGADGLPKLQMRLDLGLLQMELDGRPDGARPHGYDSLLDYFENQLQDHRQRNGTELGFHLTGAQCQSLRDEAAMYYHRYLSLFVLGEFPAVVRDTARNIRVIDMCGQFADDEEDRMVMEQYRPYITMMLTRAKASIALKNNRNDRALLIVRRGLRSIKKFFIRFGQEKAYRHASEVMLLKSFAREIKRKLPVDPMKELQRQLDAAVKNERYEEAARLRDEINQKTQSK